MAKKTTIEPVEEVSTVQAPIPGTVVLENRSATKIGITLTDGTHLDVGPKNSGSNRSRVVPKKLLPPYVKRLAEDKKIRIIDATTLGGDA